MKAKIELENGQLSASENANLMVPWWSFTKTAIATTALILVQRGVLRLDECFENQPYSLRQLLNHSAGVTDYYKLADYHRAVKNREQPWSVEKLLLLSKADTLHFAPAKGWMYSNIGYLFIRQRIESVLNKPLAAVFQELLFKPLNLTRTRLALTEADLADEAMGLEKPYHPAWVYHGLLVGPITEAVQLLDAIFMGDLLTPELKRAMQDTLPLDVPLQGRAWCKAAYGLGLMSGLDEQQREFLGHNGSGPGSTLCAYHYNGKSVVCFEHTEDQGKVEADLVKAFNEAPVK